MALSSLFPGMETYLGINTIIDSRTTKTVVNPSHEITVAKLSTEIIDDTSAIADENKDSEMRAQMLIRICDMYQHVKRFGINRTFVSLYNQNGRLDEICRMKYPACESIPTVGNPHSKYSMAFIAAMEDDSGEHKSWWKKIWGWIQDAWKWVKDKVIGLWHKILEFFNLRAKDLSKLISAIKDRYYSNPLNPVNLRKGSRLAALLKDDYLSNLTRSNEIFLSRGTDTLTRISKAIDELTKSADKLDDLEDDVDDNENALSTDTTEKEKPVGNTSVSLDVSELARILTEYNTKSKQILEGNEKLRKTITDTIKKINDFSNTVDKKYKDDPRMQLAIGRVLTKFTDISKKILTKVVKNGKFIIALTNDIYRELKIFIKNNKNATINADLRAWATDPDSRLDPKGTAEKYLSKYKIRNLSGWLGMDVYAIEGVKAMTASPAYAAAPDTADRIDPSKSCICIERKLIDKAEKNPKQMLVLIGLLMHELAHVTKEKASLKRGKDGGVLDHLRWAPINYELAADHNAMKTGYGKGLKQALEQFVNEMGKENAISSANDITGRIEILKRWLAKHDNDLITKI